MVIFDLRLHNISILVVNYNLYNFSHIILYIESLGQPARLVNRGTNHIFLRGIGLLG